MLPVVHEAILTWSGRVFVRFEKWIEYNLGSGKLEKNQDIGLIGLYLGIVEFNVRDTGFFFHENN